MTLKLGFEITPANFDGDSDETDHLIKWVLADSEKQVRDILEPIGGDVCAITAGQACESLDFFLPHDADFLRSWLIAEKDKNRPVVDSLNAL